MSHELNDELLSAYFRGVYFAMLALEGRIKAMDNPSKSDVLKAVQDYRELAKSYREAFAGTK